MRCLFIGGVSDGRRIAVPNSAPMVKAAAPPRVCISPLGRIPSPSEPNIDLYRRERFIAGPTVLTVFIVNGMTTHEALSRLIEKYPSPTPLS